MQKEITRICIEKTLPEHKHHIDRIHSSNLSDFHKQRLKAAFYSSKLWSPESKIRIGFLDDGKKISRNSTALVTGNKPSDPLEKVVSSLSAVDMVKKVVRERVIPLVNLDIDFTDNIEEANVRVSFDPNGGAWSLVGTDHLNTKTDATINLGWLDVSTVMHEFGHMLGMIHEHQNPRGQSIQWDDKKVYEWAKNTQGWDKDTTKTNILDKYDLNSINGSDFDPLSIMLYFFPADLTLNNVGTEQNLRYSGMDVLWITKMYPKKGGESAKQFYSAVYGEDIQKSIEESKKEEAKFLSGNTDSANKPLGPLAIIIFIMFLLVIITIIIVGIMLVRKRRS